MALNHIKSLAISPFSAYVRSLQESLSESIPMKHLSTAAWIALLAAGTAAPAAQNAPAAPLQRIAPFLTFQDGKAEEAIRLYVSLFKNSKVVNITRWGKEGPGSEGSVKHATVTIQGQELMASDSPVKHQWTFTPALSLYVTCESEKEIDELFKKLSADGQIFMPLDRYPFAEKFAWVSDRYGVSWQLGWKLIVAK
jgi:predicted 3-demethylubiquinone-9 3-methyltransferase (glyoxalase superfamily)